MQMTRRLAKIEEQISLGSTAAKFCDCRKKQLQSLFDKTYNEEAGIETEIHPEPDFEKGFCDECRKPISKDDTQMAQDIACLVEQIEAS